MSGVESGQYASFGGATGAAAGTTTAAAACPATGTANAATLFWNANDTAGE